MKILSPAALLLIVLVGCQSLPPAPADVSRASEPGESLPAWPEGRRFVVDRDASELRMIVRAEGPMARLGHPHVIGGGVIEGEIVLAEPFHDSALDLRLGVDDLIVDHPDWRAAEGFEPKLDEDDIAATRRNMLSPRLLNAESHPDIHIRSLRMSGPGWQPDIRVRVTVAGTSRDLTVPVVLRIDGETLTAGGRFLIRQSDFGLTPYSAAGGALQVSDEVLVRFRIIAVRDERRPS
jgi:hypothetical protein